MSSLRLTDVIIARGYWTGRHGTVVGEVTDTTIPFVYVRQFTKAGTERVNGDSLLVPAAYVNQIDAEVQRRAAPKRKRRAEVPA